MLKLPVKPPIVNENIDLSEYAKKSDVDAIGTSLGNKAEKKEVEKINSQLDTLTKKVDDEIKEIQSTTDTFKENINTSFNEFSNEQQNNFEALREEVLSDIEASYVGYDNEQHHNLESRLNSDFDKINQRVNDSSYLEYESASIKADNTYYGLTKEATVKGRTLQNLLTEGMFNSANDGWANVLDTTLCSFSNGYITVNSSVGHYVNVFSKKTNLFKPSTTYTVVYDVKENTLVGTEASKFALNSGSSIFNEILANDDYSTKGIHLIKVTTKDDITTSTYALRSFIYKSVTSGSITFRFMILEGDHTNTPIEELPFIEGIQDTGDLSKNLFNIKSATSGHIRADGTLNASATNNIASIKMNVASSKLYALTIGGHQNGGYFSFYDSNDTFISTTYRTNNAEMIVPSNAKKFIFHTQYFAKNEDYSEEAFNNATIMVSYLPIDKYEPYHTGYKVSGKSCGKNLFDLDLINKQAYLFLNGVDIIKHEGYIEIKSNTFNSYNYFLTNGIKLKPNTSYTISIDSYMTCRQTINLCNTNHQDSSRYGTILLDTNRSVLTKNFITDNNGMFYLSGYTDVLGDELNSIFIYSIQLEENSIATAYEPYQESTYSYILDEPLRKLPNGVVDSINLETGVLTRRVGKVVLEDVEETDFGVYGTETDTHMAFHYSVKNQPNKSGLNNIICDKFIQSDIIGKLDTEGFANYSNGYIYIRIAKNRLETSDKAGLVKWLKNNPTTFYYELLELTTTQLTPTQLKSFEGTTHIMSNNTLQARTSVKIPSNVQAVVTNLINENEALRSNVDILNVENEGLKETNEVQDELIDINMMATDEVYTMIEPLLASQPMSMERGMSKLVDMYVAMVQRGLKTIDQVPIRYRAEVQAILEALEK